MLLDEYVQAAEWSATRTIAEAAAERTITRVDLVEYKSPTAGSQMLYPAWNECGKERNIFWISLSRARGISNAMDPNIFQTVAICHYAFTKEGRSNTKILESKAERYKQNILGQTNVSQITFCIISIRN